MIDKEENLEQIVTPETNKRKKSKTKFIIGGFLVLVAVAVGLLIGYKKLNNDPVSIYKEAINSTYKSLNKYLEDAKENSVSELNLKKDPFILNLDAKLETNMEELKKFTGYHYHILAGIDLNNKKMNVEAGIKDNNKSIISLILSAINKNIYLKSTELFDKVLDLGEEDIFSNIDSIYEVNGKEAIFNFDNFERILKEMKTILIDSLDKDKFTIENTNITIQNKEYKAKKVIYNLDKENMERTLKYIQDAMLKNEKLLNSIAESIGYTVEDLKEELQVEIDMTGYPNSKVVIYTDKWNHIIAGELLVEEQKLINYESINDEVNIVVEADEGKLEINKDKKEVVNLKFYMTDEEILNLKIESKKEEVNIDYRISYEGTTVSGVLNLTNIKTEKEKVSANIKFSFNTSILGKEINIAMDGSYSLEKKEVTTIDPKNSIKIDDLTEEQALEIMTKLSSILEKFGLSDLLSSVM